MKRSLPEINLPVDKLKIVLKDGKLQVFDKIRKKYVILTPEEYVRQAFISLLVNNLSYPPTHIGIEVSLKNFAKQRADIVVYDKSLTPAMLIECKAPEVKLNQNVFEQVFAYAYSEKFKFIVITNGLRHIACKIVNGNCEFLKKLPTFTAL